MQQRVLSNEVAANSEPDAQALLQHILEIYDLKTVVAELAAVGEQHWSPAIVKRVVALSRANTRLS